MRDVWFHLDWRGRAVASAALVASVVLAALAGLQRQSVVSGVALGVVGTATVVAATVDSVTRRLPNPLVGAAAVAAAVTIVARGLHGPDGQEVGGVVGAFIGMCLTSLVVVCARLVRIGGIGGGDIKLAVVLGAVTGSVRPTIAGVLLVVASASGLVSAVVLRRESIALGPSLWFGWLIAESSTILTGTSFRPHSVNFYTRCCVASAELIRRAFFLGGGI